MRNMLSVSGEGCELRRRTNDEEWLANKVALEIWGSPARPRPIAAALSWLMTSAIEGFAAYGAAMGPCIADPQNAHHDQGSRRDAVSAVPASNARHAPRQHITARLASLMSSIMPGRRERTLAAFRPDMVDDRILRDIGFPPYHDDDFVRDTDAET